VVADGALSKCCLQIFGTRHKEREKKALLGGVVLERRMRITDGIHDALYRSSWIAFSPREDIYQPECRSTLRLLQRQCQIEPYISREGRVSNRSNCSKALTFSESRQIGNYNRTRTLDDAISDARLVAVLQAHAIEHLISCNTPDFGAFPFLSSFDPHQFAGTSQE
jgi:hypothetical protein